MLVIAGVMVVMGTVQHPAARWLRPAGLAVALIVTIGGGALIHQMSPVALQGPIRPEPTGVRERRSERGPGAA